MQSKYPVQQAAQECLSTSGGRPEDICNPNIQSSKQAQECL
ncbi:2547_t:CDS:1, partial [Gigaspora rosea]